MNAQISVIEPEELDYLPAKSLLRLLEKSQQAAKNFKAFKQTLSACPDLFRRLEELDVDPCFDLDNDYIRCPFTGDGMKLKLVWGTLRRAGFNTILRPEKGQTTFYAFWEREGHAKIFMDFSSSVCRRVKVGTKTVEQDVYEIQCGELPEIEPPANAVVVAEGESDDIPF